MRVLSRALSRAGTTGCSTSILRCCPRSAASTPIAGARGRRALAWLHGAFRARRGRCRADHRPGRGAGAADDTPETLAARVLALEHRCYPQALELVASGRARVVDERVLIDGAEHARADLDQSGADLTTGPADDVARPGDRSVARVPLTSASRRPRQLVRRTTPVGGAAIGRRRIGLEVPARQPKRRPGGRSGALERILRTTSKALCWRC